MNKPIGIPHLILLILVAAGSACNRKQAVIKGTVHGGEGQSITLERLDVNRTTLIDSIAIGPDGEFSFSARTEEPELYILMNNRGEILNLLLEPGDRISITTTDSSFSSGYQVEGSVESENIRMLVDQLEATRQLLDSLNREANSILDPESPQNDLIRSAYTQAIVKQKRFTIRFLVEHMTSLSSIYALYQKYDEDNLVMGLESDLQYFKVLADSLELAYPNSSLTRSLRADIEQREASFQQASKLNELLDQAYIVEGLPDLSIPDRDGIEIALSSLKGKVVQLMFWASGDQTSIETLLRLRSVYNRYHEKGFEVYSVSLDNNKVEWMKAVDFNEFDWINVSELSFPESRAARIYNITTIPTGLLINRDGEIVARNLYGRTLETWLDNLL